MYGFPQGDRNKHLLDAVDGCRNRLIFSLIKGLKGRKEALGETFGEPRGATTIHHLILGRSGFFVSLINKEFKNGLKWKFEENLLDSNKTKQLQRCVCVVVVGDPAQASCKSCSCPEKTRED